MKEFPTGGEIREKGWTSEGCSALKWPCSVDGLEVEKNRKQNILSHQTQPLCFSKVNIAVLCFLSYLQRPFISGKHTDGEKCWLE